MSKWQNLNKLRQLVTNPKVSLTLAGSLGLGLGINYLLSESKISKRYENDSKVAETSYFKPTTIKLEASKGDEEENQFHTFWSPPSRAELLEKLKLSAQNKDEEFDLLVIGGGATGAGVALDAAARGLKVALVERDDYASGTSSRSTKLVHGGVRYLEKAVRNLDFEQYKLVVEALRERAIFLTTAPHLSQQLPIMLPIYKWWQVPYFWAGSKAYDILSGKERLEASYFLTRGKALEQFPMLKKDALVGAMVYYDGQHNDSRMNISLILSAIHFGAVATNHTEVLELIKETEAQGTAIRGAKVKDCLTGEIFNVRAKGVINATGPFTDAIRKMDDITTSEIVAPSAGVHIVLPNYYSPQHMGLLDPSTSDGRVIFFLPWQGNVVAGTTDTPTKVTHDPLPTEEEITWILDEIRRYLSPEMNVRRGDVLAAWSGIRPLVRDPNAKSTEGLVRNHMLHVSENKLLTIAGGKWTTYRAMAEETVDEAIKVFKLQPTSKCTTDTIKLIGSHGYSPNLFIKLIQHFGLETEVAKHLALNYGDRAWAVAALAEVSGRRWPLFGKRINPIYPYIDAEIRYAVRNEYATNAVDVLARRTRLAFLSANAAKESLPKVIAILADELNWDQVKQKEEYQKTLTFLTTMGLPKEVANQTHLTKDAKALMTSYQSRAHFQPNELYNYRKAFAKLDHDSDGHIHTKDLKEALDLSGFHNLDANTLQLALVRVGLDKSLKMEDMKQSVEFYEFLELLAQLKSNGEAGEAKGDERFLTHAPNKFSTERSGGGV